MRIHEIMSTKVVSVSPDETIAGARDQLRLHAIHHLIVMKKKKILGVLSDRDLAGQPDDKVVSEVMTREVTTIDAAATLREAAGGMVGGTVGCLPVMDCGEVVGIVTTTDLMRALAKGAHAGPPPDRLILRKRGPRKRHVTI